MKELIRAVVFIIMMAAGTNQAAGNGSMSEYDSAAGSKYGTENGYEAESGYGTKENRGGQTDREAWKDVYIDYIAALEKEEGGTNEETGDYTYALIYVNDDDIPELVADSGYEAGGCQIVTFDGSEADVLQTSRLFFTYVERGNALCNSDGNMGYYYDMIFAIEDGKWVKVAEGNYHDPDDGPQSDENGDFIYEYEWEGESVTALEYCDRLEDLYDMGNSLEPDWHGYYIKDEMLSYLETGACRSAGHRYELVTEDVTWSEAREICEEKGGYLATITSWEEWDTVTEQIRQEDKTGIQFFVGAGARDGEEDLVGYYWLEENGRIDWLTNFNVFYDFWLPGEPSYIMTDEAGQEIEEDAVTLFFRSSDDRFYINDVPDDILSVTPEAKGRIGYICEYND